MKLHQTLTVLILLLSNLAVATSNKDNTFSDNKAPVYITSKNMHFDFKHRIFVYTDHAKATQLDNVLKGDVITAYQNKFHQIRKVVTRGKPAYFTKSNRTSGKPPLQSKADIIYFYPLKHIALLEGHAWAKQGSDEMTGHTIKYNTKTELLYGKSKPHHQVHFELVNGSLKSTNE